MALPHLTAYTTRKNIYEAAIVHRRNHENNFREKWNNNAHYFQTHNVEATKKNAWESSASFNSSMDAWRASHEKETKKLNLERRRIKLRAMLSQEREELQEELHALSSGGRVISTMRDRSEALRSAREEKRKQVAEEKMYDHWRQNNPDLRQIESAQHKQHVISGWSTQKEERRKKEEEERLAKEKYERELEEERLAALELERQKEEEKLEEEKMLKRVLKDQVAELKNRIKEAENLKKEQEDMMHKQWEFEQLEAERQAVEAQRKKQQLGRVLLRQHTAALRRKTREIQQELEEDKKLLEMLIAQEEQERQVQTSRREKARADATWMKQVIEDQIRLEKTREAELDMLYQDEAARVWEKREHEWARERQARERLMKEVMDDRADQIATKMEAIREEQEESLQRREELIAEMEIHNQMTRREEEAKEAAKTQRKQELEGQISARREKEVVSRLEIEEELEEEKKAEAAYEELLRKEAEKLNIGGYQPKTFAIGRRTAWD